MGIIQRDGFRDMRRVTLRSILVSILIVILFPKESPGVVPLGMKVFYVEFSVAPYASITKSNIETSANYELWFYGRHFFIPRIVSMLQKSPSAKALDLQNIRLKVVIFEKGKDLVYFVDRMGRISREDTGTLFELVDDELKSIHESIMKYRGVVDKKPETDPWGEYDVWNSKEK